jgi:hypothetical protein
MPTANKYNDYVIQKNKGVHNWQSHVFKLFLSATLPVATHTMLSQAAQLATSGTGYTGGAGGGATVTVSNAENPAGTMEVKGTQVVITAAGAAIGPFRYYGLYNDTASAPVDALVMWWDHGSNVTLNDGDSFTVKFSNASPGVIFTDA